MAFLLLFFFISNGGDLRFFIETATLWRAHRTFFTLFWDHCHLYSDQCYKNALITVKMTLAVKGLTTMAL